MERVEDDETELLDTEAAQGEVHGDGEGVAADGGTLCTPLAFSEHRPRGRGQRSWAGSVRRARSIGHAGEGSVRGRAVFAELGA